jgi:ectoine hydroxylase-related dioxygenase (phytanoyl-CoA dioxygenase family)
MLPNRKPNFVPEISFEEVTNNPSKCKSLLKENGFVVVTNVLTQDEISKSLSMIWDYLGALDISQHKIETFSNDFWPKDHKNGIILFPGSCVGHSKVMWDIRANSAVKTCFAAIHQTQDLITSFDGMGLFRNPEIDVSYQTSLKPWYHVDQNPYLIPDPLFSVQAFVNLIDNLDENDGGLVVLPKSHLKYFDQFADPKKGHWITLENHPLFQWEKLDFESRPIKVPCPAGSMVMFHSSVIHCNTPALCRSKPLLDQYLRRAVLYVSMEPRLLVSENKNWIEDRTKALALGETQSHWAHLQKPQFKRGPNAEADAQRAKFVEAGVIITSVDQLNSDQFALL